MMRITIVYILLSFLTVVHAQKHQMGESYNQKQSHTKTHSKKKAKTKSKNSYGDRELNGHLFLPSDNVLDPFINTYFGSSTGAGFASADYNGSGYTPFEASFAVIQQAFELQVALHKYLALRFDTSGNVLNGADEDTALLFGTNVAGSYRFGAKTGIELGSQCLATTVLSGW